MIPGQGNKIPYAVWRGQKKTKTKDKVKIKRVNKDISIKGGKKKTSMENITKQRIQDKSTIQNECRASLVAQWLRICLLMQGTRVRALVWEDPTCHGATGPVSHNC